MDKITVSKPDLLAKLNENRDKHKALYEEASTAYRGKVVEALRERADGIEGGDEIDLYFDLPKPEDHTAEYDEAIESLRWHQGDEVDLSRSEFQQWVLDKWTWARSFSANTMSYTASAMPLR